MPFRLSAASWVRPKLARWRGPFAVLAGYHVPDWRAARSGFPALGHLTCGPVRADDPGDGGGERAVRCADDYGGAGFERRAGERGRELRVPKGAAGLRVCVSGLLEQSAAAAVGEVDRAQVVPSLGAVVGMQFAVAAPGVEARPDRALFRGLADHPAENQSAESFPGAAAYDGGLGDVDGWLGEFGGCPEVGVALGGDRDGRDGVRAVADDVGLAAAD